MELIAFLIGLFVCLLILGWICDRINEVIRDYETWREELREVKFTLDPVQRIKYLKRQNTEWAKWKIQDIKYEMSQRRG